MSSLLSGDTPSFYAEVIRLLGGFSKVPLIFVHGSLETRQSNTSRRHGAYDVAQYLLGASIVGPPRYYGGRRDGPPRRRIRVFDRSTLSYIILELEGGKAASPEGDAREALRHLGLEPGTGYSRVALGRLADEHNVYQKADFAAGLRGLRENPLCDVVATWLRGVDQGDARRLNWAAGIVVGRSCLDRSLLGYSAASDRAATT